MSSFGLLWAHVDELSLQRPGYTLVEETPSSRDAKIAEFDFTFGAQEDVGWAHISVYDSEWETVCTLFTVCIVQPAHTWRISRRANSGGMFRLGSGEL